MNAFAVPRSACSASTSASRARRTTAHNSAPIASAVGAPSLPSRAVCSWAAADTGDAHGAFGAADQLIAAYEAGRRVRHRVERALRPGRGVGVARGAFGPLRRLDLLPDALDLLGVVAVDVAVHMWMAADELARDVLDDVLDGELASLLSNRGLHEHVCEDVPELLADFAWVTALDRVHQLVRLFDEVCGEGLWRLSLVPRAPIRTEQPLDDAADAGEAAHVLLRRECR